MPFPTTVTTFALKDTTADQIPSQQFYANGIDFNGLYADLMGVETQLGATFKLDILKSGNSISVSGPSQVVIGGQIISVSLQNIVFAAPGVTFVWIDDSGIFQSGASLPLTDNYLPVAQVTHGAGGVISSCVDLRPWLTGTGGGGGGGGFPANFRCTTSNRLYTRRDVVVAANTDFLPLGLNPLSTSAEWKIEIVSDTNVVVKMIQIEGVVRTEYLIGSATAGVLFKKWPCQAPLRYDGGSLDIEYQLQFDVPAVAEYVSITEIEFDALCSTSAVAAGRELIPFSVPFTFGDAIPTILFSLLAGDVLTECEVVIESGYDDVAATAQVGVLGDLGAVLSDSDIAPTLVGQYATMADRTSAVAETLLFTQAPGLSTVGSGYVAGVIRR